jgi:uncharacterized membrane protein YraQ (UPF0718 family)/copper chaperone CopZ
MTTFFEAIWLVSLELAPWLFLGLAVAGLMHVVIPAGLLARHLRGHAGVFKAVAVGVPLPLCSCGVIPAGIGLKRDGASSGAAVGFLIATPQTGVDSIFVSASMLGWPFALLKVAAALITGLVGGMLVERSDPTATAAPAVDRAVDTTPRTWRGGLAQAVDILRSIWVWLAIGIAASAALTVLMPEDSLGQVFGSSPVVAALAALVIGLPLYVCATGSVPIAAALVAAGLPLGAALVFLMAGPATNVATIGAVRRTFGTRTTVIYLATIAAGSLAFGLTFDLLLADIFAGDAAHAHHTHHGGPAGPVAMASAVVLFAAFAAFAVESVRQRLAQHKAREAAFHRQLVVDGLTCNNCVMSLEKALRAVPGVELATVDLAHATARVRFGAAEAMAAVKGEVDAQLEKAVTGAGFELVKAGPPTEEGSACGHDHGHAHG